MQIAFFAGLNATDDEKVLRSLVRNDEGLAKHGIRAPAMRHYRRPLRELVEARMAGQDSSTLGTSVTGAFLQETPHLQRVALSNPAFLAAPRHMFADGIALPDAGARLQVLQALFPGDEIEVFVALRNPASFVNSMMQALGDTDVRSYLGGYDIMGLRWSQVLQRLKESAPNIKLTVWAIEDSALIWGTVLRSILGIADQDPIFGDFDLLAEVLLPEGQGLLRQRLQQAPPVGHDARLALAADLLPQFEDPAQTWDSLPLPGWSQRTVEEMTRAYEDDLDVVAAMGQINFLAA